MTCNEGFTLSGTQPSCRLGLFKRGSIICADSSVTIVISADEVSSGSSSDDTSLNMNFVTGVATSDFTASDVSVTNAVLSSFTSTSSTTYTAVLTPYTGSSSVTVNVASHVFTSSGNGNGNLAATTFEWTYTGSYVDITARGVDTGGVVLSGSVSTDTMLEVSFSMGAPTFQFTVEDISVDNGAVYNFTATSSAEYLVTLVPNDAGKCKIDVAANTFDGNVAAKTFRWTQRKYITEAVEIEATVQINLNLDPDDAVQVQAAQTSMEEAMGDTLGTGKASITTISFTAKVATRRRRRLAYLSTVLWDFKVTSNATDTLETLQTLESNNEESTALAVFATAFVQIAAATNVLPAQDAEAIEKSAVITGVSTGDDDTGGGGSSGSSSIGIIIGAVLGGLALILIIVGVWFYKKRSPSATVSDSSSVAATSSTDVESNVTLKDDSTKMIEMTNIVAVDDVDDNTKKKSVGGESQDGEEMKDGEEESKNDEESSKNADDVSSTAAAADDGSPADDDDASPADDETTPAAVSPV